MGADEGQRVHWHRSPAARSRHRHRVPRPCPLPAGDCMLTSLVDRLRTFGRQALALRPRWDLRRLAKRVVLPFRQYLGRTTIADRHIRGSGIEIGAMQDPLPLRPGVRVRYVDWLDTEALRA